MSCLCMSGLREEPHNVCNDSHRSNLLSDFIKIRKIPRLGIKLSPHSSVTTIKSLSFDSPTLEHSLQMDGALLTLFLLSIDINFFFLLTFLY